MTTATESQPLQALRKANEIRSHVAQVRRELAAGRLKFADLDLDDPRLQGIRVSRLLNALPWRNRPRKESYYITGSGDRHIDRILEEFRASERVRVGSLTPTRKQELKQLVAKRCPSQRDGSRP